MNENQKNSIHKFNNVMFQKLEQYDVSETDTRFIKAKVWICHTGSNYNASYFSEESISDAIASLANTPILCFYTTNKEGEDDFGGHEYQLEKTDDGFDLICKEYAIGVISETDQKSAQFEERLCDDGIVRQFLTCNCTLWTKFNQAMNIFEKQNVKGQSMEITDVEGQFEGDNLYHINQFKFNGCTVLSNDCMPAMQNATIEVNFSKQNNKSIADEIENKLNEFAKYFSKKEDEGMAKKIVEEKEVKENFSQEPIQKEGEEFKKEQSTEEPVKEEMACGNKKENMSEVEIEIEDDADVCPVCGNNPCTCDDEEEDFAKKSKSDKKVDDSEDVKDGGADENKEEMSCGDKKKYTLTFSLSHEDIANQLYEKLYDMSNIENTYYYIVKTMDNYFIYCDCMTNQFYEQAYTQTEDSVVFTGERQEVFSIFVDESTKNAMISVTYSKLQKDLDEANKKIKDYSKSNAELLKFQLEVKENERKAEIDKVLSNFSTIDALDLENYRQRAYNKEINNEQLEEKLYAVVGKMNFSKKNETKELNNDDAEILTAPTSYSVSIKESTDKSKCPYDGCESLFEK